MQILLIMLIVVLLAFLVLLLALAKQSPREKQTEDKEQEEYIRDYAETVRQTGGSMKKLEHWKVIAIYLIIYMSQFIYIFGQYWNLQFLPAFHRHILNMNFIYSGPGKHFLYIITMRC